MEKNYPEKLIKEYTPQETTKLDELKSLDKKVKVPALTFAYSFGTIGTLVLGTGMTLAMKILGGTTPLMIVGIIVGVIGIAMISSNYAIFHKILKKRKAKYAQEILEKSNELLNN